MQKTLIAWKDKLVGAFRGENGTKNLIAAIISVMFAVLAIVIFICSGGDAIVPAGKMLLIAMGIILLLTTVQIVLLFFVFGEDTPNFFRYDTARAKNIPVEQITPEIVSARMDAYFSRIAQSKGQLWLPGYVQRCDFGADGKFRTVAAYKMLLDLAEVDSEGGWKCFCSCAPATVQWIADALKETEPAMMKDVLFIKTKFGTDPSKIRDCLTKNAGYLRGRMTYYVVTNIKTFDGIR